jgi:predicted GIY-YIG superfamily endonuclease
MEGEDRSRYLNMNDPYVARLMASGNRTPFERERFCVYALWLAEEVVYVGHTQCLEARLAQHMRDAFGREGAADSYTLVTFDSKRDATEFERRMIAALDPEWNTHGSAMVYAGLIAERRAP